MRWLFVALSLAAAAQDEPPLPDRDESIKDAVGRLLDRQHEDGSWGRDGAFGRDANIRSSITTLCIRALQAVGEPKEEILAAVEKGLKYIAEHAHQRPVSASYGMYDFSFYSSSFALALLSGAKGYGEPLKKCLKTLQENQREDGGFTYLFPGNMDTFESFTTGLVIINNLQAAENGFDVPEEITRRALKAVNRARVKEGYFCYHMIDGEPHGSVSGNGKLALEGSLVRSVICEYALLKLGENKKEQVKTAVEHFFKHRQELEAVRRKNRKTHQGPFDNAPYYYLIGHYFAALSLLELDAETRATRGRELEEIILKTREQDGSYQDGWITGKDYGIAMAILILTSCKSGAWY